jgi:hypothetical protein
VQFATPTSKLFWLNSKGFFKVMVRTVILYQALAIAILIRALFDAVGDSFYLSITLTTIIFIMMAIIVFIAIPYLVCCVEPAPCDVRCSGACIDCSG